jgi:heme oxygenase (biliverdin-IX-beta and delta-forming)
MARLRAETRPLHARTERHIAPAERLRDVHAYARLLGSLYPIYGGIELRVASFAEWRLLRPPLDVVRRQRAHLLAADLRALGADAIPCEAEALPEIQRFAQAFGALYVIEGSRLGGRILARQVSAAVGESADGAQRFLRGDETAGAGQLWKEFCSALSAYAASAGLGTRDAIIAGALDTFGCFDRQLDAWET